MQQPQPHPDQNSDATAAPADDAVDVAWVAALVARAGLPLTTAEIGQLVAEYRYDRRGFDRMRTMLVAADETAHSFNAARVVRPSGGTGEASSGGGGAADVEGER